MNFKNYQFKDFAANPYNEALFCEFVEYVQGEDAKKLYKRLTSVDKNKANSELSKRNIFEKYSYAATFVSDCLAEAGCPIVLDWPVLKTETPTRIHTSIGRGLFLTVCLYKFPSDRVEVIAYVS